MTDLPPLVAKPFEEEGNLPPELWNVDSASDTEHLQFRSLEHLPGGGNMLTSDTRQDVHRVHRLFFCARRFIKEKSTGIEPS
jgi:hypothetical protein